MFDEIWLNFECGAVRKFVNLVDLVKGFAQRVFTCKDSFRYSRERASQSLSKIRHKFEKS